MRQKIRLRCSELERRALCPASAMLEELFAVNFDIPEKEETDIAVLGTQYHGILEEAVKKHGVSAFDILKQDRDEPVPVRLVASRADAFVQNYIVSQSWEIVELYPELAMRSRPFSLASEAIPYELTGHADLVILAKKDCENKETFALFLIDYKTGFLDQPAESENWQLKGYSILCLKQYPEATKAVTKICSPGKRDSLPMEIVQLSNEHMSVVSDLYDVFTLVDEAYSDDPPVPVPGHVQCKYCDAFGTTCRASVSAGIIPSGKLPAVVTELKDEQLIDILEKCELANAMQTQLKAEVSRRLLTYDDENLCPLPYKHSVVMKSKYWTGENAIRVLQHFGLTAEDIGMRIDFNKLVPIIAKKAGMTKTAAKRQIEKRFNATAEYPDAFTQLRKTCR